MLRVIVGPWCLVVCPWDGASWWLWGRRVGAVEVGAA